MHRYAQTGTEVHTGTNRLIQAQTGTDRHKIGTDMHRQAQRSTERQCRRTSPSQV